MTRGFEVAWRRLGGGLAVAGLAWLAGCQEASTPDAGLPVQVASRPAAAVGGQFALALLADGGLWAWGRNQLGQLGDGTTVDRLGTEAVAVQVPGDWAAVSASRWHAAGIRTDGSLWTWGSNMWGEAGIGVGHGASDPDLAPHPTPTRVGGDTDWASVATGSGHTVALKRDGTLWEWGGIGAPNLPTRFGLDADWVAVSTGEGQTVALKRDGSLWAWGSAANHALGQAEYASKLPGLVTVERGWVAVSTAGTHSIALREDGSLWAWGDDWAGEFGDGFLGIHDTPVRIGADSDWAWVTAGHHAFVARKRDGTWWGWGRNETGLLGNGTTLTVTQPDTLLRDAAWAAVALGYDRTALVAEDGSLWSAGDVTGNPSPARLGTGTDWASVSAGSFHTLALKRDGALWAWGANDQGQVAGDRSRARFVPTPVELGGRWRTVRAGGCWFGSGYSIGLDLDGGLWVWGATGDGQQLGVSSAPLLGPPPPRRVALDAGWAGLSSGGGCGHLIAIGEDSSLWAWGASNSLNQLGTGSLQAPDGPVRLDAGTGWTAAATGAAHSVALRADGTVWTWGDWPYGPATPTPLDAGTGWVSVAAGGDDFTSGFTVAVRADGTLWAWASGAPDWMGDVPALLPRGADGGMPPLFAPVQVGTDTDWAKVGAGGYQAFALKRDGSLWAWGLSVWGTLGDGTYANRALPVRLGPGTDWAQVSAGSVHAAAVKADGSLWLWGDDSLGQLGDGQPFARFRKLR